MILNYMGDKKGLKSVTSTMQNWINVQELLRMGLTFTNGMRSEIYLQVLKQISFNPNM